MNALLSYKIKAISQTEITVTGSKSESNRLLILKALFPNLMVENLSKSDDTQVLQHALKNEDTTIDIHHAGTAMRFLTAYFASRDGAEITLTGSERMQQRPIKVLVDGLRQLGADITYLKEAGFPPLRIIGKTIVESRVRIQANVSSQYISALMLIAPSLPKGLEIVLDGELTSIPYINMTLSLLDSIGVQCSFEAMEGQIQENYIKIAPTESVRANTITVESDWSSASYFYSLVAIGEGISVTLKSYQQDSLQGDAVLASIYKVLGVVTHFNPSEKSIMLTKDKDVLPEMIRLDLVNTPDIAQTIAVSCFGMGMGCELTGLQTLKIKETDRLMALKIELEKLGGTVRITDDSLYLEQADQFHENVVINTYQDHRMAMAFAPLALKFPIVIAEAGVVSKSFPTFFSDIQKLGIHVDLQ